MNKQIKKDPLDKLFLGKTQSMWFNKGKESERLKVKIILDNLDTELVCLDFERILSKKDYQILTAFFDEINKAREKIGFEPIKHSNE